MSILSDFPALVALDDSTDHSIPFHPSPEDEAAYLALLAESDDLDDAMMAHFIAEREATLAEHRDRWDLVSEDELIECRGHNSCLAYDF